MTHLRRENGTTNEGKSNYDYDFLVIGGGSGGMAAAKEAANYGAKVALFDFVKPSTQGTKWGLGGTCVNVGCVPKKLMHYASLLGASFHDAQHLGWNVTDETHKHNWEQLVDAVQAHVKKLNFSYRVGLRSSKVEYINALASFVDEHTLEYNFRGETKRITGENILIATGGRPHIPEEIPGAIEHAITSDDIFSLRRTPGKTLVVGGSYIALECAGFLCELGFDTTIAVRSILLRGFDRQASEKIGSLMEASGVKLKTHWLPSRIQKDENSGKLHVTLKNSDTAEEIEEEYDTVLYAVGRIADTAKLNLASAGVKALANGKFETKSEQLSVPNIYAVGDVLNGKPELTPVAIQAGELLARRLYAGAKEEMNYELVPTAVFTPFEYGTVGLTEEEAIARYGEEDIEIYIWEFQTLELQAAHREKALSARENEFDVELPPNCMNKLICVKSQGEKVVGLHFIGPNAGEIVQGFALGLHLGAKKSDFDRLVGIHPTDAESFTTLVVTKRSGENWVAAGGCGGGKCG